VQSKYIIQFTNKYVYIYIYIYTVYSTFLNYLIHYKPKESNVANYTRKSCICYKLNYT